MDPICMNDNDLLRLNGRRTRGAVMPEVHHQSELTERTRVEMCSGPHLDSMKWLTLMGCDDTLRAECGRVEALTTPVLD